MKKTAECVIYVCDQCGAESQYRHDACKACGVEHCYACQKTHGVEYPHGVHLRGSGDGYYCKPCDAQLTKEGKDEVHSAYRAIHILRAEQEAYYTDFKRRQEIAEKRLKELT